MDQLQPTRTAADPDAGDGSHVEELMRAFSTALRSYRLYGADSPSLERFLTALRERVVDVWTTESELTLVVEENRFTWRDVPVYPGSGEAPDLPFQFYKDGIRELTLLPGFEDEIAEFLDVVAQASKARNEEDDLVTLLWERDLARVRYRVVELAQEGASFDGGATAAPPAQVDPGAIRATAAAPPDPENRGFSTDDFEETLYFLDEAELRRLREEVRNEAERDLWGDVLSALFDRLEDGAPERQVRIIGILGELLPSMLGGGRLDRATGMIEELVDLAARPGFLPPAAVREVRSLISQLSRPETIQQLVLTLEDSPDTLRGDHLGKLLRFFPPESLAPLMRAIDGVGRPDVKRVLEQAVERLATEHRDAVVELLQNSDPAIVAGATRWVGRLQIGGAAAELVRLLRDPSSDVRLGAIEALQELRAATAGKSLVELLEDEDREVRVAAVKALGALGYAPARKPLESIVTGRAIRAADRTEKIAFFEAYGRLAGQEGVALLDRILNGKRWLGKAETPEMRACAALALGRIQHPSARSALTGAASDDEPVVRSAVARALRGETA